MKNVLLGIYLGHNYVLAPLFRYAEPRYMIFLSPVITALCIFLFKSRSLNKKLVVLMETIKTRATTNTSLIVAA